MALVEQILGFDGPVISLVWDSLFLYIRFAPVEPLTFFWPEASHACMGLPVILSVLGVCGDLCVDGTLSVLLALESVSLYLDSPANMEFNHRGNLAPIWRFVLRVPQVHINMPDDHGTLF